MSSTLAHRLTDLILEKMVRFKHNLDLATTPIGQDSRREVSLRPLKANVVRITSLVSC